MMRVGLMAGVVFGLVMSSGAYGALKEGPWPNDPELANVEDEIEKKQKPCKKIKNPMRRSDCYGKIRSNFYAKGLVRGTEEYVQKHYEDLPTKELIEKRRALIELKEKARTHLSAKFDREPGELSREDLATEIQIIEIEMGRRAHQQFEDNKKFFEGLKNQTP